MKVLFVATVQSHIGQFHMPFIRTLKKNGYTVHAACKDNTKQKPGLDFTGIDKIFNVPFERNPYSKNNLKAYKQLKKIIDSGNYNIVHCHTPVGGILTRFAARSARKKGTKVIYTAHGFHFFKGAPKKNWLLYYPIEKFCAPMTDLLLTMNTEDFAFAKKHLKAKKVDYIPGVGIDIEKFANTKVDKNKKREEIGVPKDCYLIISIGELNKNKNYKVVLDALEQLNDKNIYYVICGVGKSKDQLIAYAKERGLENNLKLLGYRCDIAELFKASDLCIQPSFREGLPLTVMECIATKTSIIASDIRGCRDLVVDEDLFKPTDNNKLIELIQNKIGGVNNTQANFEHLQNFNLQSVNGHLLKFYKELV